MSDTPRTDAKEKETDGCAIKTHAYYGWKQARVLERELAAERKRADESEQRHADATGEWQRQKEAAQILLGKYEDAKNRADDAEKDANLLRKQNEQMTELNQGQFLQIEYLRPIFNAAKDLSYEAEEYDFPDGLGQGAQQCYWDALNDALEPKTDAIADEMKNG